MLHFKKWMEGFFIIKNIVKVTDCLLQHQDVEWLGVSSNVFMKTNTQRLGNYINMPMLPPKFQSFRNNMDTAENNNILFSQTKS